MASADSIRSKTDLSLFDKLTKAQDVVRVNEQLQRLSEKGPATIRRRLLSTSVRLTSSMASALNKIADECIERLAVDLPLELYVYPAARFNAACFKPEHDRLYVIFSSSLLEALTETELKFVMGHELGHYIYRHHDIPIGYLLKGDYRPNPRLILELFTWSRYAEISADRAGAHCANDLPSVASALFKLASGLSRSVIDFNLDDFLAQVDDMQVVDAEPGQGAPMEDWFSTHPFSPLRVKALQLFHQSELAVAGGQTVDQLEVGVQELMSLMDPSYLQGKTETAESMRRLLFAGAIAIADTSSGIDDQEIAVFNGFFGADAFHEGLNIEKLKQQLPERVAAVLQHTSIAQRMQVIRDLCLVATAEGYVSPHELALLRSLADQLSISSQFVEQVLNSDLELD